MWHVSRLSSAFPKVDRILYRKATPLETLIRPAESFGSWICKNSEVLQSEPQGVSEWNERSPRARCMIAERPLEIDLESLADLRHDLIWAAKMFRCWLINSSHARSLTANTAHRTGGSFSNFKLPPSKFKRALASEPQIRGLIHLTKVASATTEKMQPKTLIKPVSSP